MIFYAEDIMTSPVVTLEPELDAEAALGILMANKISGAPVVDTLGKMIGVVTVFDLLNADMNLLYTPGYFENGIIGHYLHAGDFEWEANSVGDVSDYMTPKVFTAFPDTTIETLSSLMYEHQIHRLVIIDKDTHKPVGIVSTFDLLKILAESHQYCGHQIGNLLEQSSCSTV